MAAKLQNHFASLGFAWATPMPGFLLISMVYYVFMDRTSLSPAVQHAGCAMLVAGIVAQSGVSFSI
jgi:hypothetical protein